MPDQEKEQQRAIEALARSEEQFRNLIEQGPESIVIFDGLAKIVFANQAAVRMFGYPSFESFQEVPPLEIIAPIDRPDLEERVRQMQSTGNGLGPREYRARRHDGSEIVIEAQSIPIEWQGQRALLSFARDVSARKEAEARLIRTERLAALGTMVAGIAHEINNPLTFTLLAVERARELLQLHGGQLPEELGTCIDDIAVGTERVATIVRDLRVFSVGGDQKSAVRLSDVVRSAARFAHNELRHRATLELELADDAPRVQGNGTRLEQVFLNLLINAVHALPEERAATNRITVRVYAAPDGWVVGDVSDNGAGIAPDHLPHIFDPFFSTKPEGTSMGLGLSICHRIVTSHGGTLEVDSRPNQGTTFRVRLPASTEQPESQPTSSADRPTPPPGIRRRVLIVDDDTRVATALERMLEDHYDCSLTDSAERALELIQEASFDIILCDLMMPVQTGMDLHAEVARSRPGLERRFVFMTGGAFTQRGAEFLERTTNLVVEKPCKLDNLLATLARVKAS